MGAAGLMVYQALGSSLVYFIIPSEYAQDPSPYENRKVRLGGLVETGSVNFDEHSLRLQFVITDSLKSYPVSHYGAPPDLFAENTGVVVEGKFNGETFLSENLLIKHSEVYEAPADGHIDLEQLKDSLQ